MLFGDVCNIEVPIITDVKNIIEESLKLYLLPHNHPYRSGYIIYKGEKYDIQDTILFSDDDIPMIVILFLKPAKNLGQALRIHSGEMSSKYLDPSSLRLSYSVRYFKEDADFNSILNISHNNIPEVFGCVQRIQIPDLDYITNRMAEWFAKNKSSEEKINSVIDWVASCRGHTVICYPAIKIILSIKEPERSTLLSVYMSVGLYENTTSSNVNFSQKDLFNIEDGIELSDDAENAICDLSDRPIDTFTRGCIQMEYGVNLFEIGEMLDSYVRGKCIDLGRFTNLDVIKDKLGSDWKSISLWIDDHNKKSI